MKYLLLISLFTGCATVQSPCNDTRYVALQKKPLDSLSIVEYDYLRRKESECDEFTKENSDHSGFLIAIVGVAITVGLFYALTHK